MFTLQEYLTAFGISALETAAVCVALWLGVTLLNYGDKSRKQP